MQYMYLHFIKQSLVCVVPVTSQTGSGSSARQRALHESLRARVRQGHRLLHAFFLPLSQLNVQTVIRECLFVAFVSYV